MPSITANLSYVRLNNTPLIILQYNSDCSRLTRLISWDIISVTKDKGIDDMNPLDSILGTIISGFVLTAILAAIANAL